MNYLITGASRGLGKAFADGLPTDQDKVFVVSRTKPDIATYVYPVHHIKADLRSLDAANIIQSVLGETPIDVLIYNAGIWEDDTFEKTDDQILIDIMTVNLTNAMLVTKALLPNIRQGHAKKIIFIGSTAGLDHYPTTGVAYAAAKFGLRGLTHSLREYTRDDGIAVTCISPGSIATDLDLSDGADKALAKHDQKRMPMSDLVTLVKTLVDLSPAACAKEIILPAQFDAHP